MSTVFSFPMVHSNKQNWKNRHVVLFEEVNDLISWEDHLPKVSVATTISSINFGF